MSSLNGMSGLTHNPSLLCGYDFLVETIENARATVLHIR